MGIFDRNDLGPVGSPLSGEVASSGGAGSGEANTGANVGSGSGVFKDKTDTTLNFKSIKAGSNVTVTNSTDEVTIAASDSANRSLGNLGSTAINADLLPANNGAVSLGSSTKSFDSVSSSRHHVFSNGAHLGSLSSGPGMSYDGETFISTDFALRAVAKLLIYSENISGETKKIWVQTGTSSASSSGEVRLATGDAQTNSGSVKLKTGLATNGVRGAIELSAGKVDASASAGPFRVPVLAADPASPLDGEVWYNSTANKMRIRANGVTVDLN